MSTHINSTFLNTAKQLIRTHAIRNQYRYVLGDVALNPLISMPTRSGIEDTGQSIDLSSYETVDSYLWQPAGPEYGVSSLHDVLMERLKEIAGRHGKKVKTISDFYSNLRYKPIEWLLEGNTGDVAARDAKIRRKLRKLGFRLKKARTSNPFDFLYKDYTITHETTHEVSVDAPTGLAGLERWVDEQLSAVPQKPV